MTLSIQQQKDIDMVLEDFGAAHDFVDWAEEDVSVSKATGRVSVTLRWGTLGGASHVVPFESVEDFVRGVNKLIADPAELVVEGPLYPPGDAS